MRLDAPSLMKRAREAWEDDRLEPIGLHDARHSFASYMIGAGVNAKAPAEAGAASTEPHAAGDSWGIPEEALVEVGA